MNLAPVSFFLPETTASSERAKPAVAFAGRFFSGGILLILVFSFAQYATVKVPGQPLGLPSELPRIKGEVVVPYGTLEIKADNTLPVWVDTHSGTFYLPGDSRFGRTPGGRYLDMKSAVKQGYRSSAKLRDMQRMRKSTKPITKSMRTARQ
ncbi:MAG: hypothetical protein V4671_06390 [Armatimonadota bacterium]